MSYTIEYNRQFIKSDLGITPCWLAGDNNVTEITFKGRERRTRDWCVFYNLLAVTEQDILDAIQPSLGGYGEHWRKNGKWVDDASLVRWVKNGCKNAASIEDILAVNGFRSVECYVSFWDETPGVYRNEKKLTAYVSTTEELDKWITEAKRFIEKTHADKNSAYPVVAFLREGLKHPNINEKELTGDVLLRHGKSYLAAMPTKSGTSWTYDVRQAMVLSREAADRLKEENGPHGWLAEAKIVSASAKDYPYNAIIRVEGGTRDGLFIMKFTRSKVHFCYNARSAKHYRDTKEAEKTVRKYAEFFENKGYGKLTIVIDE